MGSTAQVTIGLLALSKPAETFVRVAFARVVSTTVCGAWPGRRVAALTTGGPLENSIHATSAMSPSVIAVARSPTEPVVGSTEAVLGRFARVPSAAASPIGPGCCVSSVHAETSCPVALTLTDGASNPGRPASMGFAPPCDASFWIPRICAVRVCAAPLANSCTPWPFGPAPKTPTA